MDTNKLPESDNNLNQMNPNQSGKIPPTWPDGASSENTPKKPNIFNIINQLSSNDEREQTLNQLLAEMDGFDGTQGIVVLAGTNRPEILDKDLLRPGRFDRRIIVEKPDLPGREAILSVHTAKVKRAEDVDLHELALATSGATGADLANMVNKGRPQSGQPERPDGGGRGRYSRQREKRSRDESKGASHGSVSRGWTHIDKCLAEKQPFCAENHDCSTHDG